MAAPAIGAAARGLLAAYGDKLRRKAASAAASGDGPARTVSHGPATAAAGRPAGRGGTALTVANTSRYATAPGRRGRAGGPGGSASGTTLMRPQGGPARRPTRSTRSAAAAGSRRTSDLQRILARRQRRRPPHHGLTWDLAGRPLDAGGLRPAPSQEVNGLSVPACGQLRALPAGVRKLGRVTSDGGANSRNDPHRPTRYPPRPASPRRALAGVLPRAPALDVGPRRGPRQADHRGTSRLSAGGAAVPRVQPAVSTAWTSRIPGYPKKPSPRALARDRPRRQGTPLEEAARRGPRGSRGRSFPGRREQRARRGADRLDAVSSPSRRPAGVYVSRAASSPTRRPS